MKASNNTNRKPWLGSIGRPNSRRSVPRSILAGSLAVLAMVLVIRQIIPVGNFNAESAPTFESQAAATLLPEFGDHIAISTNTQSENETASQVNAKEVLNDFLLDGLEVALAGLEIGSPVAQRRKLWRRCLLQATSSNWEHGDPMV